MYVSYALWIAVIMCALCFVGSGVWQMYNKHALKPALASGSPRRFAIAMLVFALLSGASFYYLADSDLSYIRSLLPNSL